MDIESIYLYTPFAVCIHKSLYLRLHLLIPNGLFRFTPIQIHVGQCGSVVGLQREPELEKLLNKIPVEYFYAHAV